MARPGWILAASLLLALAGGGTAWRWLVLDADTNSLIAADRPFMQLYRDFLDEFGDLEFLTIVVDSSPPGSQRSPAECEADATRAVDLLLERLQGQPGLPGVHGRIEAVEQRRLATRAMEQAQLDGLVAAGTALATLASGDALEAVQGADADLETLLARGATLDDAARRALAASALLVLREIASDGSPENLGAAPPPRYLRSETGRMFFVTVMPRKDFHRLDAIREPLARIRAAIAEVQEAVPGVEIGLTGKPVLQADELETTDRDMIRSASVAAALIAILFMIVFRGVRRPLLAVAAFAMAFGWTYGVATLAVGHLNLLSIVFMLVLIGVGLDYGVHVVARFMEARQRRLASGAIREVMRTAVPGNLTGAATSAAVFLLAFTTDFQGLRELGLIAGVGLILCVAAMTFDLPALLWLTERRGRAAARSRPARDSSVPVETVARRGRPRAGGDLAVVAVTGLLAVAAVVMATRSLRFESNLLDLQAEGLESVAWEHRVFEDSVSASWFGAVIADDLEDAQELVRRTSGEPTIARTTSVLDLIATPDDSRLAARRAFVDAIGKPGSEDSGPDSGGEAADAELARGVQSAVRRLRSLATAAALTAPKESQSLSDLARGLEPIVDRLRDPETRAEEAAAIRTTLAATADSLRTMAEGDRLTLREALPAAVRDSLVAPSGRLLLRVLPSEDLWQTEPLERFVETLRSIDPQATGVPMTQFESIRDMTRAFVQMAVLSFIAVAVLVWIDFRSLSCTLVCLAALACGLGWTVGAMATFSIPLNLANFFGIPILMGLGIDSAVHMVHRGRESRGRRIRYGATARAVALTASTTAIGFGSLVFASHRGLQSLGLVMLVGSVACLAVALLLVPSLLRLIGWERHRTAA